MKTWLIKANTRGHQLHGWLDTKHTFSFANYYDPERMHFGTLRVLNDDTVEAGEGFGRHPHDNMEIITIPLKGALRHQDSMGYGGVIKSGDVQVMSAGTGIFHSEMNASDTEKVEFFQIWVFPDTKNVEPRYQQKTLDFLSKKNSLNEIVSPSESEDGLWIHQNAWFSIGEFDNGKSQKYEVKATDNGVFFMVIDGKFRIADTELDARNGLGVWKTDSIDIESLSDNARLLVMDVPMHI